MQRKPEIMQLRRYAILLVLCAGLSLSAAGCQQCGDATDSAITPAEPVPAVPLAQITSLKDFIANYPEQAARMKQADPATAQLYVAPQGRFVAAYPKSWLLIKQDAGVTIGAPDDVTGVMRTCDVEVRFFMKNPGAPPVTTASVQAELLESIKQTRHDAELLRSQPGEPIDGAPSLLMHLEYTIAAADPAPSADAIAATPSPSTAATPASRHVRHVYRIVELSDAVVVFGVMAPDAQFDMSVNDYNRFLGGMAWMKP